MRTRALVALVLLAVGAQPASAADVTWDGAGMTIADTQGESSRLAVQLDPNVAARVHDDAGGLRPGRGCLGTPRDVACGLLGPPCVACSARIDLGAGDDALTLSGSSQKGPFVVSAGAGDDDVRIVGAANAIVDGGPGADVLRADAASELDGGEGPDALGGDRAIASYAPHAAGVTVTLDGVANDGVPGEGDNVATRSVIGTEAADALTGNDEANDLRGRGGDDALVGSGGDDTLRGEGGANRILAGTGDDRVEASPTDAVKCGRGTDVATGLPVPGAWGDCETVFESLEEPWLTAGDIALRKRRPTVALGWHEAAGVAAPPISASGVVELRHRGVVIARGAFAGLRRPARRAVRLALTARGTKLACRSARAVRMLVVASGRADAPLNTASRSAIRRDARLPRVGTCASARSAVGQLASAVLGATARPRGGVICTPPRTAEHSTPAWTATPARHSACAVAAGSHSVHRSDVTG